jgi:hypothetical protein
MKNIGLPRYQSTECWFASRTRRGSNGSLSSEACCDSFMLRPFHGASAGGKILMLLPTAPVVARSGTGENERIEYD